ncbi:hypothetical protein PRCB_17780 [Pantoea rodasii]|uniref:Uncharacterized protein n=2 Tax=Pantoea rodasii TaxID=1076549 RepID=A0A2M9W997_9GAMM|nr:hypothetical protein PRCB_17780 [Pantoea rodasii]
MISDDRLRYLAHDPDGNGQEAAEMALEILRLRRALGAPWAIVEPLGEKYVGDGNAAMIWPAHLAGHGDVYLYRVEEASFTALLNV